VGVVVPLEGDEIFVAGIGIMQPLRVLYRDERVILGVTCRSSVPREMKTS
jgi:hypothetical protein